MNKTEFVWVRVGDGDPEPAALEGKKGERKATTIGCPDPFMIDEKGCPCKLIYDGDRTHGRKTNELLAVIEVPDKPIAESTARKLAKQYSYAGFGRRI